MYLIIAIVTYKDKLGNICVMYSFPNGTMIKCTDRGVSEENLRLI